MWAVTDETVGKHVYLLVSSWSDYIVEDDAETFGHSGLLRLRVVDEMVNELMHSVNEPKALKYIQL